MKRIELIEYIGDSWIVKGCVAFAGSLWLHFFGDWNMAMTSLFTLFSLDFVAKVIALSKKNDGFINAVRQGEIRSRIMREKTMYKLVRYAVLLSAGNQIANVISYIIGDNEITIYGIPIVLGVRTFFILYMCVSELFSILETLIDAGGDDLKPLKGTMESGRKRLVDKFLDSLLETISKKLNIKSINNRED